MPTPSKDVVLSARDLALGYDSQEILRDVNFSVRAGEFWFLLGPNGSGKSTLLSAILGLLTPRAGSIFRHGECADREHLGFVPQRCEFNPSLPTTVREFVELGLVGVKLPRPRRGERIEWALAEAGLGKLVRSNYWALSGGQRQRALVARALVRRPSLMIVDEPTEGLDPAAENALLRNLAALNTGEGMTLLFVTHKLPIAARYATHVALLHSGTAHCGTRDAILVPDELERAYGTSVALTDGSAGA
jgi:ABC-type Mn2+/Zn2+ transport system ATPase subunit